MNVNDKTKEDEMIDLGQQMKSFENDVDPLLKNGGPPLAREESALETPGVDEGLLQDDGDVEFVPEFGPRLGEDDPDGRGPDLEKGFGGGGSTIDTESIPDVNVYQHKKTLAQGMMDLALFSANANQLRYVLETFDRHTYYYPSIVLISFSLILQVAIGIGLIWNATYNVKDRREICIANRINNFTIIGIFLVTVINVFISAFGVGNPASST